MGLYYRRDGSTHDDPLEFARTMSRENFDDRRIAYTQGDGWSVSTVFLGLDHGFGLTPHPLLFETMIFGGPLDAYQWRWPNEVAALAGHDQSVELAREAAAAVSESGHRASSEGFPSAGK